VGDILTVAGLKVNSTFGSIHKADNFISDQGTGGFWGLAGDSLLPWNGTTVLDDFISQNNLYNSFSLCLDSKNPSMTIGADYFGNPSFNWTSVNTGSSYQLNVTNVLFGNNSLVPPSTYQTFPTIDSSQNYIALPSEAIDAFESYMQSLCTGGKQVPGLCAPNIVGHHTIFNATCQSLSPQNLTVWPPLLIYVDSLPSPLVIPSQSYLGCSSDYQCCIALTRGPFSIGTALLENYNVVFDRTHQKLGFGPLSSCPFSATGTTTQTTTGPGTGSTGTTATTATMASSTFRTTEITTGFPVVSGLDRMRFSLLLLVVFICLVIL